MKYLAITLSILFLFSCTQDEFDVEEQTSEYQFQLSPDLNLKISSDHLNPEIATDLFENIKEGIEEISRNTKDEKLSKVYGDVTFEENLLDKRFYWRNYQPYFPTFQRYVVSGYDNHLNMSFSYKFEFNGFELRGNSIPFDPYWITNKNPKQKIECLIAYLNVYDLYKSRTLKFKETRGVSKDAICFTVFDKGLHVD